VSETNMSDPHLVVVAAPVTMAKTAIVQAFRA